MCQMVDADNQTPRVVAPFSRDVVTITPGELNLPVRSAVGKQRGAKQAEESGPAVEGTSDHTGDGWLRIC